MKTLQLSDFRKNRVKMACRDTGVDLIVASLPENLSYLADGYICVVQGTMNRSTCFIGYNLNTERFSYVVSYAEIPTVLEHAGYDVDLFTHGDFRFSQSEDKDNSLSQRLDEESKRRYPDLSQALVAMFKHNNASVVALDEERISVSDWKKVESLLPSDMKLISGTDIFMQARYIKHEDEIAGIERAARVAEDALMVALAAYQPGMTEKDIEYLYKREAVRQKADPFFFVGTAGQRAAYSDTVNTDYVIQDGDMIRFDFGVKIGGYCSDIARTAVVGSASDKLERYFSAVKIGMEEAIKAVRPGISAEELFKIAVSVTQENGIPHYWRHHVGHGIGVEMYDYPTISLGAKNILEPNMVINLETPYYEPGWGGVQVESTIAVTQESYRVLDVSTIDLIRI